MQQTETYKLGLIETSDTFSPDTLNDNTRKVEDAMLAHEAAVSTQTTALDQRVTVLELKHVVAGGYIGNGSSQIIDLGFTPVFAMAFREGGGNSHFNVITSADHVNSMRVLLIVEGGIQISGGSGDTSINSNGGYYSYIAFN